MRTDFFVRFGPMEQTEETGFWWADFRDTLLENTRALFMTLAAVLSLSVVVAMGAKFLAPASVPWVLVLGSLSAGAIHLWFTKRQLAVFITIEKWIYSIVVAAILFASVTVAIKLFGVFQWLFPIAAMAAFLLPVTVEELWQLFNQLPTASPQVWFYSANAPLQKSTTFLNSIPVKLLLHLTEQSAPERLSFQAPLRMNLGTVLFHTVQEGHAQGRIPINLADPVEQKIWWIFYTTNVAGQRRYLDPEKGLAENRIKRNAVIHAQRQTTVDKALTSTGKTSVAR